MIRTLLIALTAVSLFFLACSGDKDEDPEPGDEETPAATRTRPPSNDSGDLADHEDKLRETVPAAYKAIFAGGAVQAYKYASDDFKDKCSLADFTGIVAIVKVFLGDIEEEDIDVEVTDVTFDDDRAFVTVTGAIMGEDFSPDEGDDEFSDFWVYEDGEWKWGTDDEDPCDSNFDLGDGDEDATPASGPGSSRAEPAALGETVDAGKLRVSVIDADTDAASRLETLSEFPSTPIPGRRVVLARVLVEYISDDTDETIQVYESDFKITGSGNVVYDTFGDDTSCGFLEDTLQGEMFPGGSLEGNVCFQVPETETDLLLIAQPSFSFSDNGRRYFALE
jgi:hypothetical protein